MKTIVISAVNLRKGGTLTILRQCLQYLSQEALAGRYRVVALVHNQSLAYYPAIEYIEMPHAINGWLTRLRCEYQEMLPISEQIGEIDLWFSLHDTTPNVRAKRQAVYCQTSFPFFRWKLRDFRFDPKIPLFGMLTKYAYRINIHRNLYLVVQQRWLRDGFSRMFGIAPERFIVAPPERSVEESVQVQRPEGMPFTFFFASTPDSHKGFETLCQATKLLEEEVGANKFQVILTTNGGENKYARYLYNHWGELTSLVFYGLMDRETLHRHYALSDCFVFPSRIETWGLPISEFMIYEKPMILSDLPYAHETSAGSKQTAFFPSTDAEALKNRMKEILLGDTSHFAAVPSLPTPEPVAPNWESLFNLLLADRI